LAQQEQATAELQAFCSASIKGLGLEPFRPLLLKGAVASWPAVDKWSLDWLVEQYGEQRLHIENTPPMMQFAWFLSDVLVFCFHAACQAMVTQIWQWHFARQ
jgi:hypothetical protein